MASLAFQMTAFISVIMGVVFLGEKVDGVKIVGFLLALTGLLFIFGLTDGSVTYLGVTLVLFGAFFWSVGNIIVKKSGAKHIFSFLIWSSLFSPIPLFLLAYLTQGQNIFIDLAENIDSKAALSIAFQVYPTTLFGYWIWNSLIEKYEISNVAPLSLLVPIFGLLGSYFLFNETIGMDKILACVFIVGGLVVATFSRKIKLLTNRQPNES